MTTTIYVYDPVQQKVVVKGKETPRLGDPHLTIIDDDFPADVYGKKCPQTGLILTSKRKYAREVLAMGYCQLSPKEHIE